MAQKLKDLIRSVMAKANDGVKFSELSAGEQAAANQLLKRGHLVSFPIPNGDWIINKP